MIPTRFRSQSVAFAHDLVMVVLAWLLASWIRFNLGGIPAEFIDHLMLAMLVVLPVQAAAFSFFGLYKGIWRFASLPDLVRIIKAVLVGTAASMLLLFLVTRGEGIPRSIPVVHIMVLVMLLGGPRLLYRWLKDRHLYSAVGPRVLIVGAGQAGEMLVRDMSRGALQNYQPVAFVDENRRRFGREIHGVPILGGVADIPALVRRHDIEMIMLARPSASARETRRIVEYCEQTDVPFLSVPELKDLVSGRVAVSELREVAIEDLLGREQVALDWPGIEKKLHGRRVLVSGGGGSIGAELCRQVARLNPESLLIVDNSEFNLYAIELELRGSFPGLNLECLLCDVLDTAYLDSVFARRRPEMVFHAAAYKHVPMLETQVRQALRNNVLGTRNIAETADRAGVDTFVLVSTDKAVNPGNVMGASKRAAEICCQNLNARSATRFITVRFGNVLGSAGSVIPRFRQQIAAGGPVTVTDLRMERFFMTIPEACQLILQTTVMGEGGEIFVLDMGEPIKINYLAEQMIRLSGKTPGVDIDIVYTGLRPGEKLCEELFHALERLEVTAHEKVRLARHRPVDWTWLNERLDEIADACVRVDEERLVNSLKQLVPEYGQQQSGGEAAQATAVVVPFKQA